jgi:hypothetical protein
MTRVARHRLAVEMVHAHQDLATWRAGAVQRNQRSRQRPGAQVAIAGVPDQAGLVDILAGDVETEDRDRHVPAAGVDAGQFVAPDDLAASDAIGVGEHDVEGLDLRVCGEKCLRFAARRSGR